MPDDIEPHRPDDDEDRTDHPAGEGSQDSGLPPELEKMFESLTGGGAGMLGDLLGGAAGSAPGGVDQNAALSAARCGARSKATPNSW